jgi:hypothetical protein
MISACIKGRAVGAAGLDERIVYWGSRLRLLLSEFATQMQEPSNAIATGDCPTLTVPRLAPSLGRSLITLLLTASVTQMLSIRHETSQAR